MHSLTEKKNCKTDRNNNNNGSTTNCYNCDCENVTTATATASTTTARLTKLFHSSNSRGNNNNNNSSSTSTTTNTSITWNRLRLRENFLRRQKSCSNNCGKITANKVTKTANTTTSSDGSSASSSSSSCSVTSANEAKKTNTNSKCNNISSNVYETLCKICGKINSNNIKMRTMNNNNNNKSNTKNNNYSSKNRINYNLNENQNNYDINGNCNTSSSNDNDDKLNNYQEEQAAPTSLTTTSSSSVNLDENQNYQNHHDPYDENKPNQLNKMSSSCNSNNNTDGNNKKNLSKSSKSDSSNHSNNDRKSKSEKSSKSTKSTKTSKASKTAIYGHSKWGGLISRGGSFLIALMVTSTLSFTVVSVNCQVCSQPPIPLNAKVKVSSDFRQAHYECDPGYELFGSSKINCDPIKGWEKDLPFCGINIAFRKPVNQSSYTRQGPAIYANDGKPGNDNPDGQQCSETQKEPSPWWRVDLLRPQSVRVVRITTRGCCGHQPLQDLEIRVGNSSTDLQRNPLCAWYPGTVDEGVTKTFSCARAMIGQYVAIQLVGVEGSLSLCEVEVFSNDGISTEKCLKPNHNVDAVVMAFGPTCYEFYFTRGESFVKAQEICQTSGGNLIHNFRGVTKDFIVSELERRKSELKTQLVWIGAQKEPGLTSRTWKWINGELIVKPAWGKDQPNNYNGEQNCVVLDGGRTWLWNDVGCNLDYLHFICQHAPLSCGSPDSLQNTTVIGQNYTVGNEIIYSCPEGHALVGDNKRICGEDGQWSGQPPTCKFVDCGILPSIDHGAVLMTDKRTTFSARATYVCNENYTLVGNESRTCDLSGWTGSQPECLVDWCPAPPHIEGGRVKVTNVRAGSTAQYECEGGYVMFGEPTISCGLGGEWVGKPPVCRFVDCGAPARPDRGIAILINDSTTVGSVVKYQCNEDHWLVGPSELSCTKEGRWSGDAPICELITCDTPHVPPGSYVLGYDYNVHSSIEYHCDPGHILRGNPILQCLETGEWSGDAPSCEYVDCGILSPIPYGTIKYMQNTTYLDSEVIYSCVNTHRLSGVSKRTCLESGQWSNSLPKCEEIRCSEPVLAPHSILSVTGNDRMYGRTSIRTAESVSNSVQTYKIGSLAKYRCERGYKISGDPLVTCEEDGKWSGLVPECIYVDCGSPAELINGTVTLTTNATYYGAAAIYECHKNFKLDGVSRRLCLENATWSHETPVCREITCNDPEMNENLIASSEDRFVGASITFSCMKGRYLVGNDTRKCLKNGQWSGKPPTCKPMDCGRPQSIENGRVIVINESTIYGASAEYHCVPNYNRIGPYLRKCLEDGKWSGTEPKCEFITNEAQNDSSLGMGIGIGASIIVLLLILIGFIFLYRNKARPVKNTENVQAAESKEDRSAAVMSYSTLDASNRHNSELINTATFNTFHQPNRNRNLNNNKTKNIYDQIPNEQFYDAPYEMRSNEEVYEPEPTTVGNVITINGISVR